VKLKTQERARYQRNNSTLSVLLLKQLKGKQMHGFDFDRDRQKPIDNYRVDFFCNERMLAIEIAGDSHDSKEEYDKRRQTKLESFGVRFLRFTDLDVKRNMEGVIGTIASWILRNKKSV